MKRFLLLIALVLGTHPSVAQTADGGDQGTITKTGTTAAQFLKLGVGPRAISMGGAFVAEASDLSALYWNPAGLARLQGAQVMFNYTDYLVDVQYSAAAFGTNLGRFGTLALSLIFLDSGEMDVRTTDQPEGTGERFDVTNFALQLSYARALTDRFSIGGNLKYVNETIWHSSASAMAFDVGVLFTTPYRKLRLGASMSNFGPKMQMSGRDIQFGTDPDGQQQGNVEIVNAFYEAEKFSMPLLFKVGLAWDAVDLGDYRIILLTDASHPIDNSEYLNLGGEFNFRDLVYLRLGYRNLFEKDGEQTLTYGGGLNFRIDRSLRVQFDYAYADFGRLENTQWFGVNLGF